MSEALALKNHSETLVQSLCEKGYFTSSDFFPLNFVRSLKAEAFEIYNQGLFRTAQIGKNQLLKTNQNIRTDEIFWLRHTSPIQSEFLKTIESLKDQLNKELYMGINNFEFHYSVYREGSFYKRHLDSHKNNPHRRVSFVIYLNDEYKPGDGGELFLYNRSNKLLEVITPELSKMVIFLSEKFPHEVTKTQKLRFSLTGWFRHDDARF